MQCRTEIFFLIFSAGYQNERSSYFSVHAPGIYILSWLKKIQFIKLILRKDNETLQRKKFS